MGIAIGPAYDVEAEARGSTKGSVVKSCKTESTPRELEKRRVHADWQGRGVFGELVGH